MFFFVGLRYPERAHLSPYKLKIARGTGEQEARKAQDIAFGSVLEYTTISSYSATLPYVIGI